MLTILEEILMKNRNSLLTLGITQDDLVPTNYGRLPDGVTRSVLWELWDICLKYGMVQEGGVFFRCPYLLMAIQETSPPDSGVYFTIVKIKYDNTVAEYVTRLSCPVVQIKWDQSLDPVEVADCIQWIDGIAIERQLKDGGVRMVFVG